MAFLVFEGLDGSGKSTLIEHLAGELKRRGCDLVLTREPGGTAMAEDIRKLLLRVDGETPVARAELLLYEAARAQHVERVIRPALAAGLWVVCDRFTASSVAFQCYGRELERTAVDWLNKYAVAGIEPDLFILLDLPVEKSLERRQARTVGTGVEDDRFEKEKQVFHEAVRRGYLAQANEDPQQWLVLDAQRTQNELFDDLMLHLTSRSWLKR